VSKLDLLQPWARPYFDAFINVLEARGLQYSVLETLRTEAVQIAYYAQGRAALEEINSLRKKAGLYLLGAAEAGRVVTHAIHSVHQDGEAADIVPVVDGKVPWVIARENAELWLAFGRLGQEAGLIWGGIWRPLDKFGIGWDFPHYQYCRE
jgi:peptidoglycan L-alanyl-D-glutamate endopeptidase CwlK